jgi:hypothetical protein
VVWRENVVVLEEEEADARGVRETTVVEVGEDVGDDVELTSDEVEEEGGAEETALDDAGTEEETGCGVGDCMFAADEDDTGEETELENDGKGVLRTRFPITLFPLFPLFPLFASFASLA